ncbi:MULTISPECIES: type II toxin-antitoxin system RelB/DinJ family antitoxin [Idiomarina]|jgi:antitoxin component of RelBE/YafQ-DinJ toxin-antitoxin module|uniref:Type II toxin-antitoxin system RelB/DinJ family antitoxin n=1 Tax=Idiomarina abyssalis TaxID=86102 RepID=A0A8I1G8X6_9GAMM|nr:MULTISPECIES: type II toxin-antitoxin system RelB/DinJ family antitoxin [Idiomarina]MBF81110.1 damage-inducible protein J [Idiomarina sp.]MBJ7266996.1 type II toxin-antitoxin system RelB/DinJ family antitoxin [Idiomarina abyssalis]MBJ7272636.1 type II toxin-antitoxin system RelB/DinJ family antitoxin [Idiomarina abyssalis]MBJ7316446.1 type II toxin-antitoxin system RelB/DinJ family antitoxin [Idiomarina abyssalis]MDA6067558.1 type II toxin-antitoxin system RelB/DinJ family antitoxin [Idioma|tara:strand:- start:293 stop:565 length:273 start_codon:yes stop_codon:yes gene_type:complete
METRIQFRIDEQTKHLAQQQAESEGRTLSDACRQLAEQLASERRKQLSQNSWLTEQVNQAFQKLESGQSEFMDNEQAKSRMEKFKAQFRK